MNYLSQRMQNNYPEKITTENSQNINPEVQTMVIRQDENRSNGIGTAGFVLSLMAIFVSWIPIFGWFVWFIGLILSFIGLFKAPRGLAIAGLVISLIGVIILIVFVGAILVAAGMSQ